MTPSTLAAATAASTALPPERSTSRAAEVARTSTVAAAPPRPVAVGVEAGREGASALGVGVVAQPGPSPRHSDALTEKRSLRMGRSLPAGVHFLALSCLEV